MVTQQFFSALTASFLFLICTWLAPSLAYAGDAVIHYWNVQVTDDRESGPLLVFTSDYSPTGQAADNRVFKIFERETPSFFTYAKSLFENSSTNSGAISLSWEDSANTQDALFIKGINKIFSSSLCRGYEYSEETGITIFGNVLGSGADGAFASSFRVNQVEDSRLFNYFQSLPLIPYVGGKSLGDTNAAAQNPSSVKSSPVTGTLEGRAALTNELDQVRIVEVGGGTTTIENIGSPPPAPAAREITVYTEYFIGPACLPVLSGTTVLAFEFFGVGHKKYGKLYRSPKGWAIDFMPNGGTEVKTIFEIDSPSFFGHSLQTLMQVARPGRELELLVFQDDQNTSLVKSIQLRPKAVASGPGDSGNITFENPIIFSENFTSGTPDFKVLENGGDILDSERGTLEFWIRPNCSYNDSGISRVFLDTKVDIDRLNSKVVVAWDSSVGLKICLYNQGSQFYILPKENIPFQSGVPFRLAITWNRSGILGTAGNVRVYFNGAWKSTFGVGINNLYLSDGPNITNVTNYLNTVNPAWGIYWQQGRLNVPVLTKKFVTDSFNLEGSTFIPWYVWVPRTVTVQKWNFDTLDTMGTYRLQTRLATVLGVVIPPNDSHFSLEGLSLGRGLKVVYPQDYQLPAHVSPSDYRSATHYENYTVQRLLPWDPRNRALVDSGKIWANDGEVFHNRGDGVMTSSVMFEYPRSVLYHTTRKLFLTVLNGRSWDDPTGYSAFENDIYDNYLSGFGYPPYGYYENQDNTTYFVNGISYGGEGNPNSVSDYDPSYGFLLNDGIFSAYPEISMIPGLHP